MFRLPQISVLNNMETPDVDHLEHDEAVAVIQVRVKVVFSDQELQDIEVATVGSFA